MQKTIKIDGMMCAHCEATVKNALEAIVGEGNADVSHENDVAVVTVTDDVSIADLTKAIEDNDYKVVSIN